MLAQLPRVLFAAASSGSGKTTVTSGILRCLDRRGANVHAYKCGPDYIDPMFHRSVLNTPCRNLDLYFSTEDQVRTLLAESALAGACAGGNAEGTDESAGRSAVCTEVVNPEATASQGATAVHEETASQGAAAAQRIAVLEGVMGYYDGLGGTTVTASAYHVAQTTNTPVILIADGRGASLTLVASLKGIIEYRQPNSVAGVIINRCTKGLAALLAPAIEKECGIPVLGYVPNKPEFALESRHLGLVTANEVDGLQKRIDAVADTLEETIDIDALLTIAQQAPALEYNPSHVTAATADKPIIAVAQDEAFCFYYEESLELLRKLGAELAFFSPLAGDALPAGTCGVYLGGGYPELHAAALAENKALARQLRKRHAAGMPLFAECGGFMYLQESLTDIEGHTWPMAGVIPGEVHYTGKLSRFGYIELTASEQGMGLDAGDTLRAHEFHYFDSSHNGQACHAVKYTGKQWDCCVLEDRLFAGFPHFYLPNCQKLARGFVEAAAAYKRETNATNESCSQSEQSTTNEPSSNTEAQGVS